MDFLILFVTGFCVGLMSSFFGIGGGSIMIPTLYWLYPELTSSQVIGISFGTIFLNTSINNLIFFKQKLSPNKKTIFIFFIMALIGTSIGREIVQILDTQTNKKIFAYILLSVVLKMFAFGKSIQNNNIRSEPPFIMAITSILGSFVSSLTGLGGGIIYNPMLIIVAKLPLKYISPFSNAAINLTSLLGVIPLLMRANVTNSTLPRVISNSFVGEVNLAMVFILFMSSLSSIKIGIHYNNKVTPKTKKYLLSIILLFFAIKMI